VILKGIIIGSLLLLSGQYVPSGAVFPHALACSPNSAWPMNEGSGLTLNDTSGHSNTATINSAGSVTWTTPGGGLVGTFPDWTGTGFGLATSTTLNNFDGTTPFSVGFWEKTDVPSVESAFLSTLNASAGTFQGWEVQKTSTGEVIFFLINTFPSNAIDVLTASGASVDNGALFYIGVSYDGSKTAAGVKIYINGAVQATSTVIDTLTSSAANGLPVRFAARNNATDEFKGITAFAEVYPCVVSSAQWAANFAAGPGIH
jgi:hypothetical protein